MRNRLEAGASPDELLDELGIRDVQDIDVEAIAQYCNATIVYKPLRGCEGQILGFKDRAIITVDKERSFERQRFTAGHELGHWMYDRQRMAIVCTSEMMDSSWQTSSIEKRANEFSANLLLPRRLLRGKVLGRDVTFEVVADIASEFQTSLTATAIKIVDDGNSPAMVIACRNGRRVWFRRGPDVPTELFPRETPLKNSYSFDFFNGAFDGGAAAEIEANAWFDLPNAYEYEVVEDIVQVGRNVTLTLLWWRDESQIVDFDSESE